MDDLEEELLQVAGRSRGAKKRSRKRATSSDEEASEEEPDYSDSDNEQHPRKSTKRQSRKSAREDDDEEEDDDADDPYGPDLYINEEDRRKLEAMTELEREMILAERAEERDKIKQRKALLKTTKQAEQRGGQRQSSRQKKATTEKDSAIKRIEAARKKQEEGSRKSRGKHSEDEWSDSEEEEEEEEDEREAYAPDEDEEEEEERVRQKPHQHQHLQHHQHQHQQRGVSEDEGQRSEDEDRGHRTTRSRAREEEEEEDELAGMRGVRREAYDEGDYGGGVGRAGQAGGMSGAGMDRGDRDRDRDEDEGDDEGDANIDDVRGVQLTRTQLEAMWDKPYFEGEGMNGAVVRMAYGGMVTNERGEQVPNYLLMQIVGVVTQHRSYPFGPKGAPCSKYLQLVDGMKVTRTMPMQNVSNQPLSEAELERWKRHARRVGGHNIPKAAVEEAQARITAALNYRWDANTVREVLARKREAGALPVNVAAEKSRLRRLLEAATAAGDEGAVEAAELEAQLRDLDIRVAAASTNTNRTMDAINIRNRQANFNAVLKSGAAANKAAAAGEGKSGVDVFSRRATRPNIYWKTGNTKEGEDNGEAGKGAKGAAVAVAAPKLRGTLAHMDPSELVKVLDVDIDVTPLLEFSVEKPLCKRLLGPRWQQSLAHHTALDLAGKTVLTVADWKQRAGIA